MYEITHNDSEALDYYVSERIAYPDAVYDFTFENRFLIYHAPIKHQWSYFVLDMKTRLTSEAYHGKKPLKLANERDFVPYIYDAIKYTGDKRYVNNMFENPVGIIDSIFRNVLPDYGFNVREEQIELSKQIYRGFTGYNASLCEAEVGTGKSLAYLVAGVVLRKCYGLSEPITITTSNIELQNALVQKEIPLLSKILMDYRLIDKPLNAVVRKGKEHYFCRFRFENFYDTIKDNPDRYEKTLRYINENDMLSLAFDLDALKIPIGLKSKICVKGTCGGCPYKDECKYQHHLRASNRGADIFFQVTNHNLYLTSERLRSNSSGGILKPSSYVVIDEAHKLKETASDVFGEELNETDVARYLNMVKHLCADENKRDEYKMHLEMASDMNSELFELIRSEVHQDDSEDDRGTLFVLSNKMLDNLRGLEDLLSDVESHRKKVAGGYGIGGKQLIHTLSVFVRPSDILTWASVDPSGKITLNCCPKKIGRVLFDNLWNGGVHHILMSGTMSVGSDFSYFEKENGISHLPKGKVQTSSTPSPFDYAHNTRLYIPDDMPIPPAQIDAKYLEAIADRITTLVKATNGHTAILFTSYKALNAVYELTKDRLSDYELICMTRSNKMAISDFKKSRNAVLFASGSMWEGVDCVGDKLSSVIIVRLPFPLRSATMEEKKSASKNIASFIDEFAVPEMLIKLRQGIGRLIRSETDTGVISILDGRASRSDYADRIRSVLGKYPEVESINEIEAFIKAVKPKEYFEN